MAHIHEKYDFVVSAFIVYENKILLIDHKKLNLWLPVGGHIELDEDPEMALWREIEEESGLDKESLEILTTKPTIADPIVMPLYTPNYLDVHQIYDDHKHIAFIYFFRSKTDRVMLAQEEHHEIKWFSLEEIEDTEFNTVEAIKFYCREAVKVSSTSF